MQRSEALKKVDLIINGPRAKAHGDATETHNNIAAIWNILLRKKLKSYFTEILHLFCNTKPKAYWNIWLPRPPLNFITTIKAYLLINFTKRSLDISKYIKKIIFKKEPL